MIFSPAPPFQWTWISLVGPDAQDFLHRVTTVNARNLTPGEGAPGCFLTGQGRIRAYFTLWCYGPGEFAFEFDAGKEGHWKTELLSAIEQFTFSERMTLAAPGPELECLWLFPDGASIPGADALQPGTTLAIDEEIRLCHHGRLDYGRDWITAWGRPSRLRQWAERALGATESAAFEELETLRIKALRPRADVEITPDAIPLEVGLRDAIAENKGCYPGQEVVEKIISLGAPPRKLTQIRGEGEPPMPGEAIFNLAEPPAEIGRITSVAREDSGYLALSVLRKIHAKEGLDVRLGSLLGAGRVLRVAE